MITGTQLLEAIADHIEAHPEAYDQGSWCYTTGSMASSENKLDILDKMGLNDCNTRGCIAGWAVALNIHTKEVRDVLDKGVGLFDLGNMAQNLLGLDQLEAETLFHEAWEPAIDMDVPEALRLLAKGVDISEVTMPLDGD